MFCVAGCDGIIHIGFDTDEPAGYEAVTRIGGSESECAEAVGEISIFEAVLWWNKELGAVGGE